MMTSLAFHAGAFALYYSATHTGPRTTHFEPNIGFIEVHQKVPPPTSAPAPKPPPPTIKSFLSLALPSVPKISVMDVKAPEETRIKPMLAEPKLEDRAHKTSAPIMPKLDLNSKHSAAAPSLNAIEPVAHHAAPIAQMARLEDVGTHQVRNLKQAIALEDRRREASDQAILQAVNMPAPTHVHVNPAVQALAEATPEQKTKYSAIVNMLPPEDARHERQAAMVPASEDIRKKMQNEIAPPPKRSPAASLDTGSHKAVEIEGALKDRQVTASAVPPYPDRLKSLGIPEIVVKLDFCVEPAGDVVGSSIKPEESSGYGWLDRLTEDSLRSWKFAELGSQERQCGAITFRYELE